MVPGAAQSLDHCGWRCKIARLTRQGKEAVPHYRVVDLLSDVADPAPIIIDAQTPEKAAELALGVSLTRSGAKRNLRARVYCEQPGQPVRMVRLYGRVSDEVPT